MRNQKVTFSFGKNWKSFLSSLNELQVQDSIQDVLKWLDIVEIKEKRVLDIGSGSGLHSLSFYKLGVKEITSFDFDSASVEATRYLWRKQGKPISWQIFQGSILDEEFLSKLDTYDIVYAWGVLHHTGHMWKAIKNAAHLVDESGYLWISIYVKGPNYPKYLNLKKKYNASTIFGKKMMVYLMILRKIFYLVINHQNPFKWNKREIRGMDSYHDILDWLGGLPYEVASASEIIEFCKKLGFKLIKLEKAPEGGCNVFLFKKP